MANKKRNNDPRKMVERLKRSSAYRLAFQDQEFLEEDLNRPVRLQLELRKPEVILQENKINSTIVVFGGTRIVEPSEARANVRRLESRLEKKPDDKDLKRKLRVAKSILSKSRYYDEAREFGRLVSLEGQKDGPHFSLGNHEECRYN